MRRHAPAFTLIELLVVVSIIAVLAGLLIPGIAHFRRVQRQAAITAFNGTLQMGLVGYHQDYKGLPPSYLATAQPPLSFGAEWNGGEILAQSLVGPLGDTVKSTAGTKDRPDADPTKYDDGKDGYGFRSFTGKTSGPYVELKNDRTLRPSPARSDDEKAYVFTMYYGEVAVPFLYYLANPGGQTGHQFKTAPTQAVFGESGRFDTDDNKDLAGTADAPVKKWESADEEDQQSFAVELRSAAYLIVHPGADQEFGTDDDVYAAGTVN